ncbi:MAG TPA: twin-arginine translocase subunit TatC [Candidatus Saccharimonadales bacterium]|nr:twin-arginine translocase subunit TatC [Candidatus Saccharimonadales bacterium]
MALRKKRRHQSQPKIQTTKPNRAVESHVVQTFTEHIRELRKRLFWSILVGLVAGTLVYTYHDFFVKLIMQPLNGQKLIYLTPTGGFSFIFMVTFYVTILLILPFLMYQLYAFLKPAIPTRARNLPLKVVLAATILMAMGATFGYLYAVPGGLRFLTEFASSYVTPSLTAESYLSFVLGYVFGIGLLFELPLLLLFWHWISPIKPKGLLNSERYIIVGAFIAAAIISPSPDALSQTIIAVPIIIVYQFGVISVLLSIRKARKVQKKAARNEVVIQPAPIDNEVKAPALAVTPKPVVAAAESTVAPPLPQQPLRRKVVSIDGMVVRSSRPVAPMHHASVAAPSAPVINVTPRSQPQLQVPNRRPLISDFGPMRG